MNSASRVRPTSSRVIAALAITLVLAVVGMVAGVAAPSRADAATTHLTITGASSTYHGVSRTLKVSWKVGHQGHKGRVTFERRSGTTWKKLKTVETNHAGVAKIRVKPSRTTTYRVRASNGKKSHVKKLTVHAAYSLTSTSGSKIIAGAAKKFSVTYRHDGKHVKSSTVTLQRLSGKSWVEVAHVHIHHGTGSVTVRPTTTTTYRFHVPHGTSSTKHKVTVHAPSSFEIEGSGSGHGVGMSQYGAYEMALEGHSANSILSYYYPGSRTSTVNNPSSARVAVQVFGHGSDSARSTSVSVSSGAFQVVGASGTIPVPIPAHKSLKLTVSPKDPSMVVATGGLTTVKGKKLEIRWDGTTFLNSATQAVASVEGAHGTYRNGELVVTAIDGRPNVVNDVLLNTEYLYGIDEMPSVWGTATRTSTHGEGLHALEAQAIAARGYALTTLLSDKSTYSAGVKPTCGCNLYDDTRSQNYTGWRKQGGYDGSVWKKAVDETVQPSAGTDTIVRDANGAFAETDYFAATGYPTSHTGGTANNQDAFGGKHLAYLAHKTDPYTTRSRVIPASDRSWSEAISQKTAAKIFDLTTVRSVSVTHRYSSGQVKTLEATSDDGHHTRTLTKTAEGWRTTLGLRADWVTRLSPRK